MLLNAHHHKCSYHLLTKDTTLLLTVFSMLYFHPYVYSFFNWIICGFFCYWVVLYEFFTFFDINPLSVTIYKNFLPFCRLPFYFIGFLCCIETFLFDVVFLAYVCFCCFWFWYETQKIIMKTDVKEVTP